MANEFTNEDVLFDRLVDGELTGDDRRRLLESLDRRPDGWRRCALAFLEAQSWREELGQVARGKQLETVAHRSPALSSTSSSSPGWAANMKWFAIAASLLTAFGLGWLQHRGSHQIAGGSAATDNQVAVTTRQPKTGTPNGNKPDDALTFYVRDESGRKQPVRVPLVDADTLDNQLGVQFQTGVPDTMRNQLKEQGYTVQSKRKYAPLWLENGRPMIVPVEDTRIVPVSNHAF